jgi:hypothetical protein
MPPTNGNADDHMPAVKRTTPSAEDAPCMPVTWWARHGDWGVDAWADIDGQIYVYQVKNLVPQTDAQRMARRSVLVFLDACGNSGVDLKRASSLRQLRSMIVTQNYDMVLDRLVSESGDSESVDLLAALPDPGAQSKASTFTGVVTKLLTDSLSHWSDVAGLITVVDGLGKAHLDEPHVAVDRWRFTESARREASVGSVCPLRAVAAAQHATSAAYKARDAVVHEDPSVSREVVARFTSTWLGFQPTAEIVEATAAALLYAALDDFDPDDDSTLVHRLKRDTRHQNRLLKPLTSTQICGRPIDSLDRPLRINLGDDDTPSMLGDTVGVPDQVDEFLTRIGGWNDARIGKVLARLYYDERRVALMYARMEAPATWQQAAQMCGLAAEFGERVRRKLHREGRSLKAIQTSCSERRSRAA